ncbi:MAG: hypothetical protein WCI18_13430 [Pseudomonadota bacterium]
MNITNLVACLPFILLLTHCAHYPDVRPSDTGNHSVSFMTESSEDGYRNAKSQADSYCDDVHKKRAYISKEENKYKGSMDEKTYKNAKTAAKVTGMVGTAGYLFGGKKQSEVGGIVGLGGGITDAALGSAYRYTMYFRCK